MDDPHDPAPPAPGQPPTPAPASPTPQAAAPNPPDPAPGPIPPASPAPGWAPAGWRPPVGPPQAGPGWTSPGWQSAGWQSAGPGWAAPQPPPPAVRPDRTLRLGQVLALVLGAVLIFAAGTAFGRTVGPSTDQHLPVGVASAAPSAGTSPAPSPDFGLIQQAFTILQQDYVDPAAANATTLIRGAIKGMADSLDDTGHTTYLTADQLKARDESLSGTFVGIGAVLDTTPDGAVITRVLPDSPAEKAGLRAGEIMVSVDGQSVSGLQVSDIVSKVRGPEGSTVTLGLKDPDGTQRSLTITRAKIDLPLVSWAFAPNTHIAVIRLESFSKGAATAMTAAITQATAKGATAIALDLRGNPGGYVDEAVSTASQFLSSGVVYLSQDRSGKQEPHDVVPGGKATKVPLAVVVDGQTASSAEIVTGAIQDAGRGIVVGEKTFGTGTVVGTYPLSDGSALTIGTERWFTPKGRAIWREGLTPDKVVALPDGVSYLTPDLFDTLGSGGLGASKDAQLQAAIAALAAAIGGAANAPAAP